MKNSIYQWIINMLLIASIHVEIHICIRKYAYMKHVQCGDFFWLMTTECVFSKDYFHFIILTNKFSSKIFWFYPFSPPPPHVSVPNFFFKAPHVFASLFLRIIINIFIQVIFPNIITYLDRTFKEELNYINFKMK